MEQITVKEAKKYIPCQPSRLLKQYGWELTVSYFTMVPSVDPKYKGFDDIKYYTNKLK
jgi:hypothetical protein